MNEFTEENNLSGEDEDLWLTLTLANQLYAVKCSCIDSIFELQQKITTVPLTGPEVLGITTLRGMALPLISLRLLLGIEPFEVEQRKFTEMLERRKQDHIEWVTEFERCVSEHIPFTRTADPHACAFGKWYDAYKTDYPSIRFQLNQIDEPHKKLHESAHTYESCLEHGGCDEAFTANMLRMAHAYSRQVVSLLDDTIAAFHNNHRNMCVALSDGVTNLGILVDEIRSAEKLKSIHPLDSKNSDRYVSSVGIMASGTHVLLLNEVMLLSSSGEPRA